MKNNGPLLPETPRPEAWGSKLTDALLAWFAAHRRDLPWRVRYTPYEVWISEMMLQQTQMERGVAYFLRWMARFPDVAAVAAASEEDILSAWEGLGYYRRARYLHAAAKAMMERHEGRVPESAQDLAALPGLGPYTVAAIRGIAFQHDAVVVDANVERVFARLLNITEPVKTSGAARRVREEAERLLPGGRAREYNEALMEFGALVCGKVPRCEACPLAAWCASRRLGLERERPVAAPGPAKLAVIAGHGLLAEAGRALVVRRPETGLWGGMWEFPGGEILPGETPDRATERILLTDLDLTVRAEGEIGTLKHGYTNHRLTAYFYRVRRTAGTLPDCGTARMASWEEIAALPMPAHQRKMATRWLAGKRRREQGVL